MALPFPLMALGLFCLGCCALLSGCVVRPGPGSVVLAEDSGSDYHLVIGSDANDTVKAAADELADHLEQITGARLAIVTDSAPAQEHEIIVGPSSRLADLTPPIDPTQLDDEEYVIRTVGQKLIIVGGPVTGTINGVYVFLEDHLGCRWYADDFAAIPKQPTLKIEPLDVRGKPFFEARQLLPQQGLSEADVTWRARMRLNGFPDGDPRFDQSMRTAGAWCHSLAALLPAEKHFDEHPEYFSEINGKRVKTRTQICATNPGAVDEVVKQAKRWLAENPGARLLSVTHNDWANYCQCDRCSASHEKYNVTGTYLRFVNAVAKELAKDHPDVLVDTFAYQWTIEPPRNVKPARNVVIRYAPIESCSHHAYDDPDCIVNIEQGAETNLGEWCRISPRVWIWYYILEGGVMRPYPSLNCLQRNFKLFQALGVKGFAPIQMRWSRSFYMSPLKSYIAAKLMWDSNYDVAAGIDEFCHGYFGAAGEQMLQYVKATQDQTAYQCHPDGSAKRWPDDRIAPGVPERYNESTLFYPPRGNIKGKPGLHVDFVAGPAPTRELLRQWMADFQQMQASVADDPAALSHVRREYLTVLWCCLLYLPPDDLVRNEAQQQWLPLVREVGGVFIADPRSTGKLWFTDEDIAYMKEAWPEFCPTAADKKE